MADLGWTPARVAELTHGELRGDNTAVLTCVRIDSRAMIEGALFVALLGDRFDGHDFIEQAQSNGAAAVLVDRLVTDCKLPQIIVNDTLLALQILGLEHRRSFNGRVIAITGSSGKTTTRKLVASILEEKYITLQPEKNFNNHIGVPLTLLEIEPRHEAVIMELGCSDFGEIALLTKLCEPDVGLVTNVGPAHLEKLGDLDGVARAKGELFVKMRADAKAVVNLDDPHVAAMRISPRSRISFGSNLDADVRLVNRTLKGMDGQEIVLDIKGNTTETVLPLLGAHNAANAVAAAATAVAAGLDRDQISQGLNKVTWERGRLGLLNGPVGTSIIDDTYNANPASVRAALAVLEELSANGRGIAVLGDMLELGETSDQSHREVGGLVEAAGTKLLVTMGPKGALINQGARDAGMDKDRCIDATSHQEAAAIVSSKIRAGDFILVKGSRGMEMEKVIASLEEGER